MPTSLPPFTWGDCRSSSSSSSNNRGLQHGHSGHTTPSSTPLTTPLATPQSDYSSVTLLTPSTTYSGISSHHPPQPDYPGLSRINSD